MGSALSHSETLLGLGQGQGSSRGEAADLPQHTWLTFGLYSSLCSLCTQPGLSFAALPPHATAFVP